MDETINMDANAAMAKHFRRLEKKVDSLLDAFSIEGKLGVREKRLVKEAKRDIRSAKKDSFTPVSEL